MSKKPKIEIPDQVGNENRGEIVLYQPEGELMQNRTVKEYLTVQKEGKREVSRKVLWYNLDIIISVGYRVKSIAGTRFRQWALGVLKEFMLKGYAINQRKIATDLQIADRLHEQRQLIEGQGTEIAELKNATEKASRRKLAGTNSHKSFLLQKRVIPTRNDLYHKTHLNQSRFCFFDRDVCFPNEQSNKVNL